MTNASSPQVVYAIGAIVALSYYLKMFLQDTTTPKQDLTSWLVVVLGASLWPITLPMTAWAKWRQSQ